MGDPPGLGRRALSERTDPHAAEGIVPPDRVLPKGCSAAIKSKTLTPNQISTAYEVDALRDRGLDGSGVRVATLSGNVVGTSDFRTWAKCFNQPAPKITQFGMPSGVNDTQGDPDETILDVEALAFLAPKLERILPIFVPQDNKFNNPLLLFLLGALDPARQGGKLPHILSISDGICEYQFTKAEKWLAQRLLAEAAAIGITTLAASGDAGYLGCDFKQPGAQFPASSRFVTAVGGTNLGLNAGNRIISQPVWSTYAKKPSQGAGSGGGPSRFWPRPAFQAAPGLTPSLQKGRKTRLLPDVAAMGSFLPGHRHLPGGHRRLGSRWRDQCRHPADCRHGRPCASTGTGSGTTARSG